MTTQPMTTPMTPPLASPLPAPTPSAAARGYDIIATDNVPIKAWVHGVPFEDEARAQVARVAALPFVHHHVAVMPDVHAGIGATVGSVIACRQAVIPAAVGVDRKS